MICDIPYHIKTIILQQFLSLQTIKLGLTCVKSKLIVKVPINLSWQWTLFIEKGFLPFVVFDS